MTRDEFHDLAMIHGADLERWPGVAREAARAMAAEPWAAALLAELALVDRHLAATDVAEPSPDRIGRAIAGTIDRISTPPKPSAGRILAWVLAGAGGLAASASLGVALALHSPLAQPPLDALALVVEAGDLSVLLPGLGG